MLARDGIFSAKFRGCTARATAQCRVGPKGRQRQRRSAAPNFFARELKFIRLPLDNACDRSREKICSKFFAARRYPQKRWKTSG
jgi:hypothetical protein